jgi:transposase-like protein
MLLLRAPRFPCRLLAREGRKHVRTLEREVRELRQANEILRKASACLAQAEFDRPGRHNNRRLPEPIGNIPPAEAEARYHAEQEDIALAA